MSQPIPEHKMWHTVVKTGVYRLIAWSDTVFLAWLLIGNRITGADGAEALQAVALFGTVDMVTNTFIYFWFDRLWVYIIAYSLTKDYHVMHNRRKKILWTILGWLLLLPVVYAVIIGSVYLIVY